MIKNLSVLKLNSQEVIPYLEAIARLRMNMFKEFPYLSTEKLEFEMNQLNNYLNSSNSIFLVVLDKGTVVGASLGMPLLETREEIQKPFVKFRYDLSKIFYFGESVLLGNYRGMGIGHHFFNEREATALEQDCDTAVFCTVLRPNNHPRKPHYWHSLSESWTKKGYVKHPELTTELIWKDIDDKKPSKKTMIFWIKTFK